MTDSLSGLARRSATIADAERGVDMVIADVSADRLNTTADLFNAPFSVSRARPNDRTPEQRDRAIGVCLTDCALSAQQAGRRTIAQGTGGCVVNAGSIAGETSPGRGNFVVGVTRSGVHHLTRELATEWAKHCIRVSATVPSSSRSGAAR